MKPEVIKQSDYFLDLDFTKILREIDGIHYKFLFKKINKTKEAAMKTAIFHLTKIIGNGENGMIKGKRYVRVDGWENVLTADETPEEYLEGKPRFFVGSENSTVIMLDYGNYQFAFLENSLKGSSLIPADLWFNEIEPALKASGERLSKILQEQKWNGSFEVKI